MSTTEDLFHPVIELPEAVRAARYQRLVGVEDIKDRLRKEAHAARRPRRYCTDGRPSTIRRTCPPSA